MGIFSKLRKEYSASLKSMDTEETIDLLFYRPIGFVWAKIGEALGITPNAITIASIFIGIAGGVLLYYFEPGKIWLNYLGILLIIVANSLDSADGQLARMTHQYSRLGRILDGMSGDLWFITIYIAICLRETASSEFFIQYPWLIWIIAVAAGWFHAKQAYTADYYRQFHLYFLKGEEGSELDSCDKLDEQLSQLSWKTNFREWLPLWFYRHYTANQELLTPGMQRLRRTIKEHFGDTVAQVPQQFRDDFRHRSKPLMKYTNWLTFNVRVIVLFITVVTKWPWFYFAFELVALNALLFYTISRHERICRQLTQKIQDGDYQ